MEKARQTLKNTEKFLQAQEDLDERNKNHFKNTMS